MHTRIRSHAVYAGIAYVCLVTASMTLVRCKVEKSIPRKRKENESSRTKVG